MQRFSRYRKRQNQYYQKKMFRTDCKKFYNLPREKNTNVQNAPTKETENFWREIFGKKTQHNTGSKNQCQQNPNMERSPISETEIREVLRMTLNWKAPGRDKIAHFCLKQLKATYTYLETPFNKLTEVGQIPDYGQE